MKRVIAIGLSPNTQKDDVFQALKQMMMPFTYQRGFAVRKLEKWFEDYFKISYAVSFCNARSALYAILKCLDIKKDDEVILQAFTCIVVPNAVLAVGAKPVYADIGSDLTLDLESIEKKITKNTKAIIVQHTFGIPSDMDEITKIAKKNKLYIIEDVAHSIGGKYKDKKLGTMSDAAIFSFGRDKAFSSVFGGIALTNDQKLGEKINQFQNKKPYPSFGWIIQQLFHPIAFFVILPLYNLQLGKLLLILLQKFHLLSFPVQRNERKGKFEESSVKKYPNALAALALRQIKKTEEYNKRRSEISGKYKNICGQYGLEFAGKDENMYLRFPVFVKDPDHMKKYFRKKGKIFLGDWYANIIDPKGSELEAVKYKLGMCPNAENYARQIINLPTYPALSDEDVKKICSVLKQYAEDKRN